MRNICIVILGLCGPCFAQTPITVGVSRSIFTASGDVTSASITTSALNLISPAYLVDRAFFVTDSTSLTICDGGSGGGNVSHWCVSDGTAWLPMQGAANVKTSVPPVYLVPSSATPVFDALQGRTQILVLTSDVASSTIINTAGLIGEHITTVICQDGTGGRAFAAPSNFRRFTTPSSAALSCSVQEFVNVGLSIYMAVATGVTGQ